MKHDNYYQRRGITIAEARNLCHELGLVPCYWNNLRLAIQLLEVMKLKY
ncbi:MAG TPA: hypothetical protein VG603_01385 [Chitinophagales bacterium]|nr:hypothetical protein [Chitinophagales bacterium]